MLSICLWVNIALKNVLFLSLRRLFPFLPVRFQLALRSPVIVVITHPALVTQTEAVAAVGDLHARVGHVGVALAGHHDGHLGGGHDGEGGGQQQQGDNHA